MDNVMIDLETLGTRPGSVIFSIGAVFFDETGVGTGMDRFYDVINVASCCVAGLRGDVNTINWWNVQSPDARAEYRKAFSEESNSLKSVLEAFSCWLVARGPANGTGSIKIWGNGAAFDNALLAEAYKAAGLEPAWKFYNDRCFRTLKSLPRAKALEPKNQGTPHHALDDAVHQAYWAAEILRMLSRNADAYEELGNQKVRAERACAAAGIAERQAMKQSALDAQMNVEEEGKVEAPQPLPGFEERAAKHWAALGSGRSRG